MVLENTLFRKRVARPGETGEGFITKPGHGSNQACITKQTVVHYVLFYRIGFTDT